MRRRLTIVLALTMACGLGLQAASADGPGCSGKKNTAKTARGHCGLKAASEETARSDSAFPTLAILVSDTVYDSAGEAEQAAKANGSKVVFAVADEKYDSKEEAMAALAVASEEFTKKFLTIACVIDGKLVYCDEKSCDSAKAASSAGHCGAKAKAAGLRSGSCCSKSKAARAGHGACGVKGKAAGTERSASEATAAGGAEQADARGGCPFRKTAATETADANQSAKAKGKGCCSSRGAKKASLVKGKCSGAKCEKFLVAGQTFKTYETAVKARDEAREAAGAVKMKYIVDGREIDNASKVCPQAKAAGEVQFVVNDEKTHCELTARIALAKSRYQAAQAASQKRVEL